MTEKDLEIQQLRRENAEVKKQRDLLMQENDELRKELHELKERLKPKKPIDKHYEEQGEKPYIKYACPACVFSVNAVGAEEKAYQNRYCHKCGQALDWSDEE